MFQGNGRRFGHKPIAFEQRSTFSVGIVVYGIYVDMVLAAVFLAVMAFLLGFATAAMLTGLLIIHEFGHAWGMRLYGIPVKGFYFLPPIGLAVVPDGPMRRRIEETDISLLGPVWGLGSALLALGLWWLTGWALWPKVAMVACWLNLFNLLPVNPLDGGRVVKSLAWSVHPKLGIVIQALGLVAGVLIVLKLSVLVGLFILYFGFMEFRQEYKALREIDENRRLYGYTVVRTDQAEWRPPLTGWQIVTRTLAYLGTIAAFVALMLLLA